MSLKQLNKFQKFDVGAFLGNSQLLLTKIEEWKAGEDADHLHLLGTKVTGVIAVDGADYGQDLRNINRGESLTIKVEQPLSAFENWKPFSTIFQINEVTRASVYGDFRNHLSLTVPGLERIK